MKLLEHFREFLADVVNLNATRLSQLEKNITAIEDVIKASDWGPTIRRFVPQGSWAHNTIIRPVDGKPFDADLLVFVDPMDDWDAKRYIDELFRVFQETKVYKDKVVRYSHCVTIEYAGERRVDLTPCVIGRVGGAPYEVCNRSSNDFEESEPEKYTEWLLERNRWTGGNGLKKATRLLKYLRDVKETFACPSFLLTILLGERINAEDAENWVDFKDVPTALKTIIGRLDDWLQRNERRPVLVNPALSTEQICRSWSDINYQTFRARMNTYRGWIDEAFDEEDIDESIAKWRRVFGDDFARKVAIEKAASVSDSALAEVRVDGLVLSSATLGADLVSLFQRFGRRALPRGFDRLPHKRRPHWKPVDPPPFEVKISATLHSEMHSPAIESIAGDGRPLPRHHWLQFRVYSPESRSLDGYRIFWQITNTDRDAYRANCLRGDFYGPSSSVYRWEELRYRGVHCAEAFVVCRNEDILVARSCPLYVSIA